MGLDNKNSGIETVFLLKASCCDHDSHALRSPLVMSDYLGLRQNFVGWIDRVIDRRFRIAFASLMKDN